MKILLLFILKSYFQHYNEAIIFDLAHGNVKQGVYTFLLGIIITAAVYVWTKSIWSNIAIHITFNLFGSLPIPDVLYNKVSVVIYIILGNAH